MAGKTLEDRVAASIETISGAMKEISQTNMNILRVQQEFNDNFILHSQNSEHKFEAILGKLEEQNAAVTEIRKDFKEWFYPLMGDILRKVVYVGLGALCVAAGLKVTGVF